MNDTTDFDPFDMDREEFNPELCMQRYAEDCNLQNMLSRKLHIDSEISSLKSDLGNMLYDNYRKFINAADVVSTMKKDFQEMEKEMDFLDGNMNIVEETSSGILANLRASEDRMVQLLKAKDTMKKLVLLTKLVPTLKRLLNLGMYNSAARYYLKAENVLKKYQHLASLRGIVKDCQEVTMEIIVELRKQLSCDIYGKEELSETLNLIVALGEPLISTVSHFLSCCDICLVLHLSSIEENWKKEPKENTNEDDLINLIFCYIDMCCNHVEKVEKVLFVVKEISYSEKDITIVNCINEVLMDFFTTSTGRLTTKILHRFKEEFQNVDDYILAQVLDKFNRKCHSLGILTSKLNFYQKGLDVTLAVCVARCELHLKNIKTEFNDVLSNMEDELTSSTNFRKVVAFLEEWTGHKLTETLRSVVCFIRPEFRCCREGSFRKVFSKVLVREGIFISFFRHINEEIWFMVSRKDSKKLFKIAKLPECLIFAKYLLDMQKNIVPQFLFKVDESLSFENENSFLSVDAGVSVAFINSAERIIKYYVNTRSENMICLLCKSMETKNWMMAKEPIRPRAVIKMLVAEIEETKIELEKIFVIQCSADRDKSTDIETFALFGTYLNGDFQKRNNINGRILLNKLFNKCFEISDKIEPNTFSVMDCILRKILKSFIEYIRLHTFNRNGLQQIQVDICYFYRNVSKLIDFNNSLQFLFEEILSSAFNRTLKAELMKNEVVSAICNNIL